MQCFLGARVYTEIQVTRGIFRAVSHSKALHNLYLLKLMKMLTCNVLRTLAHMKRFNQLSRILVATRQIHSDSRFSYFFLSFCFKNL